MGYKKITISLPDWFHDQYLIGVKNKSALIVEMFIKGFDHETGGALSQKAQLIILTKKLKSLEESNKKLHLDNSRLKTLTNRQEQKREKKRRDALLNTHRRMLMEGLE